MSDSSLKCPHPTGHVTAEWPLVYPGLKIFGRRQVDELLWRGTEAACSIINTGVMEAVEENPGLTSPLPCQGCLAQVICLDS